MGEWQSIETAPKDGTKIFVTCVGYEWPEVAFYQKYEPEIAEQAGSEGFWRYADDLFADVADIEDGHFTYWMPLPNPPE